MKRKHTHPRQLKIPVWHSLNCCWKNCCDTYEDNDSWNCFCDLFLLLLLLLFFPSFYSTVWNFDMGKVCMLAVKMRYENELIPMKPHTANILPKTQKLVVTIHMPNSRWRKMTLREIVVVFRFISIYYLYVFTVHCILFALFYSIFLARARFYNTLRINFVTFFLHSNFLHDVISMWLECSVEV